MAMEIIKKKICFEDFRCRVPGTIVTTKSNVNDIENNPNGAFGEIPKNIYINDNGRVISYRTLMSLYYKVLKIVMEADFYEYDKTDKNNRHWIKIDYDWRNLFDKNNIVFYGTFPTDINEDKKIIALVGEDNVKIFYESIQELYNDNSSNGVNLIKDTNKINGRIIVPYANKCTKCGAIHYELNPKKCSNSKCDCTDFIQFQPAFVPYFLYYKDVEKWISLLDALKEKNNCCDKRKYEEYGGEAFEKFLKDISQEEFIVYNWETKDLDLSIPTINIPILLTSKLYDIGMYRTYDVDVVEDLDNEDKNVISDEQITSKIISTQGESKLQTLRKRKHSIDDNNNVLPFIINKIADKKEDGTLEYQYKVDFPYEVDYVKNITMDSDTTMYGDAIYSMQEKCDVIEISETQYNSIQEDFKTNNMTDFLEEISEFGDESIVSEFGDISKNKDDVLKIVDNDVLVRGFGIVNGLKTILFQKYPKKLGLSYPYKFIYNIKYGVKTQLDVPEIDEITGDIITTKIKEETDTIEKEGKICVICDNTSVEVVYVLGGKFKYNPITQKLSFNESSLFDDSIDKTKWDGKGVWYRETFPMKKACKLTTMYENKEETFLYDEIDFQSKETTLEFDNIDFPRKNYILCEEIRYNSDKYQNTGTNDAIFKDEKMTGLNFPLRESYDVLVDRGMSVAFEKHLQLCDVKTWQDLENYRNGMFLNK